MWNRIGSLLTMAAGVVLANIPVAAGETLTFVSWGGAYQSAQVEALVRPFGTETGVDILEDSWGGELSKVRAMVETGSYTWDVIDAQVDHVRAGCDEGILEVIDYERIGGRDQFVDVAVQECGVGTVSVGWIYAYNADRLEGDAPQTWADFWDLDTWPGKRALLKDPKGNLEWALLADGVAAQDVYDVLRTDEGVARAFSKLDELKGDVVWWEAGAQPVQLLADGEVVMTSAWNGRIFNAVVQDQKNFKIVWDGQLLELSYFVIPKGSPNLDVAYRFIEFAFRPDRAAAVASLISYGPTVEEAVPLVDAEVQPFLPTTPEHMENAIWFDEDYWADMREELMQQFTAWLAR